MVNYANGQVYRLVNNVDEKYYIGSTCNSLHKRKNGAVVILTEGEMTDRFVE